MPLIRGIRDWFGRRINDSVTYATTAPDWGLNAASWLWLVVFIVVIPVVAVLVLIGLIYELIIRIDGRRLGSTITWALSSAAALALLLGLYVVLVSR